MAKRKRPRASAKSKKKTVRKSVRRKAKPVAVPAKGKWVYSFGDGRAEGKASLRNLLGGKGAGLAEMANLGLPVPPGFTITTDLCTYYYTHDKQYPKDLRGQVEKALVQVGRITGKTFGDKSNPLLVSVRSGARASMPGMMDTVLNLGLNDETVEALAKKSGDRRFAYDSYRRFITMYSDVVLGVGHEHFEELLDHHKERQGYSLDTDLSADDWAELVVRYKKRVKDELRHDFPQDPHEQLWGAIGAVFGSWMNQRAITYRRLTISPKTGVRPSTCRPWFSVTWATPRRPALPSRAIHRRVKRSFTASSSSTRRARMSSPASVRRRKSAKRRARRRAPTSRRWSTRCPRPLPSSNASTTCSSATTATCRTSNSLWSRASSGCCRQDPGSAPRKRRYALRSSSPMKG